MGASSSWLKKNSRSFWSHLTSTFFLYQSSSSTPFSSSNIVGGDMFGKFSELSPSSEPSWSPPLPPEPLPLGCGECGFSGPPLVSLESSRGGVGISTWGFGTDNGKFCGSCGFLATSCSALAFSFFAFFLSSSNCAALSLSWSCQPPLLVPKKYSMHWWVWLYLAHLSQTERDVKGDIW